MTARWWRRWHGAAAMVLTVLGATHAALASEADRQGQFARPPMKLQVCVAYAAKQIYPDLHLILNASPPQTVRAMSSRTKELNDWTIEFQETGSGTTNVVLRSSEEWKPDVGRIWQTVELCAEQS